MCPRKHLCMNETPLFFSGALATMPARSSPPTSSSAPTTATRLALTVTWRLTLSAMPLKMAIIRKVGENSFCCRTLFCKKFYPSDSRKLPPPWQRFDEVTNSKRRIPVKPPEEREEEESQPKNSSGSSINTSRNGLVLKILSRVNIS